MCRGQAEEKQGATSVGHDAVPGFFWYTGSQTKARLLLELAQAFMAAFEPVHDGLAKRAKLSQ